MPRQCAASSALDARPPSPCRFCISDDINWLFAGSLRAGKRAAAIMSLLQSARLNGHKPFAYRKDVLTRLPTQP